MHLDSTGKDTKVEKEDSEYNNFGGYLKCYMAEPHNFGEMLMFGIKEHF